ncbi:MAG: large conductance mechanosensitive channel protein MscL [Clostridia bacterium]|nr:large conductance mechanosensitive channel protein MscL [Clostridia bacterium]
MAKEKKKGAIKKFFEEFKTFITRGNVLDMAVGVIVGGAFTAIVNGLSNSILRPIINWLIALIVGTEGLSGAITMLSPAYQVDATTGAFLLDEAGNKIIDLANSIYIDWGAFISAIINFLLIAFVLFSIVKIINRISETNEKIALGIDIKTKKEIAKIRIEEKVSKKRAKQIYQERLDELKRQKEEEAKMAAEAEAQAKRLEEEKATANTRLLEEIRDLLKENCSKNA